jgi:RNA polymerase sigma factor (sigma-70 family)
MALEWGTSPEMIELSDERLASRGAQGDRRAFEAIYRRYHQELYRFCVAMLGSPHDAQDTLQNTMVKVLRALPGEERQIKLKPWLYRIARNEAIETLRGRRERIEPEPEQAAPNGAQIAERAEDRERLRRLFADLEQLPSRQRGALVMRELSGLSFEEIAEAFETSPATARQTVYEARQSLRQMEAGREMSCEATTRALSEADGRSRRRRDLTAHLRSCASCRAFAAEIDERRAELAALAPLPLAASSGILHGALAGGTTVSAGGGGVLGGATAGGAAKVAASSAIAKSAATVAVAAVVGVSVAGRAGLIDVPLANRGDKQNGATSRSVAAPAVRSRAGDGKPLAHGHPDRPAAIQGHSRADLTPAQSTGRAALSPGASARPSGDEVESPPSPIAIPSHGSANPHRDEHSRGKPGRAREDLPATSAKGQRTAPAHKSPPGSPAPAGGPRSPGRAHPETPTAPPEKAKAPPTAPAKSGSLATPDTETPGSLEQPATDSHAP